MDSEKTRAAVIIHSFAVANAAVGAALANTVVGDAPFLTVINVAMIYRLGKLFDVGTTYTDASAAAGTLLSTATKTYLTSRLLVWIPLAGNVVNATLALGSTEMVGWMAFLLFQEGKDSEQIAQMNRDQLQALKLRAEIEKISLKEQIDNLPPEIKAQYAELEQKLKNIKLSEEQREAIIQKMIDLLGPFVRL